MYGFNPFGFNIGNFGMFNNFGNMALLNIFQKKMVFC